MYYYSFLTAILNYLVWKFIPMKQTALFCSLILLLFSCKKSKDDTMYKVTYTVTGNSVNQFKFSEGSTDNYVETPFAGTMDTTVYVLAGTVLKLDTKADNNNLIGTISVNDVVMASGTDTDIDGDNKTQVKLDLTLPHK